MVNSPYNIIKENGKYILTVLEDKVVVKLLSFNTIEDVISFNENIINIIEYVDSKYNDTLNKSKSTYKKVKVICLNTGIIYNSLREASTTLHLNEGYLSLVCRGKKKSIGGCQFRYLI